MIRLQFMKPIQKIPINTGEQKKHVMKKYLNLEKQAHFEKVVETKKEDETDSGFQREKLISSRLKIHSNDDRINFPRKDSAVMSFSEKKQHLGNPKETSQSGLLKNPEPVSPSVISGHLAMNGLESPQQASKPHI